MTEPISQVMISTYNGNYRAPSTISRFFIAGAGTASANLNTLKFTVRNPNAVTVNPTIIEVIERVQGGFVKLGFGQGLTTLTFNATMPAYRIDAKGNKVYEGDYRQSEGWLWLGAFDAFVLENCEYPFALMYHGTPSQFLEIPSYNAGTASYNTYILKGTCSRPAYSQDANDPRMIKFSFNFSGISIQQAGKQSLSVHSFNPFDVDQKTAMAIAQSTTQKIKSGLL